MRRAPAWRRFRVIAGASSCSQIRPKEKPAEAGFS
jgi:hypothetical protein